MRKLWWERERMSTRRQDGRLGHVLTDREMRIWR